MKSRMLLLAKADFAENRKLYFTIILATFLLFFVAYAYINLGDINPKWSNDYLIKTYLYTQMMAITACCTILTESFRSYHKRGKAIFEALLPVGRDTKFLYILLKQWIIFPFIVFLITFINVYIWSLLLNYNGSWDFLYGILFGLNEILSLIIIAGVAFLSSTLFKRFQLVYAFIILFIAWGIMFVSRIHFTESVTQTIISLVIIAALITATWLKYKYLQIKQ